MQVEVFQVWVIVVLNVITLTDLYKKKYTTVQRFWIIKLIKVTVKAFLMLQNISVFILWSILNKMFHGFILTC